MEKENSMQEHMGNVSREVETQRKNQKEMQEVKNTVTEMENAFDGSLSRLTGHDWGKNQWVWRYVNRNFQNQDAKKKKKQDARWKKE